MFQYIGAAIACKMLYTRVKNQIALKDLRTYGDKVGIPYLGEKVETYRTKLLKERDRRQNIPQEKTNENTVLDC